MPRGNTDNLKPVQSKEEARERGRAGGIASGIARRERKTLREELTALLEKGDTQKTISLALIHNITSQISLNSFNKSILISSLNPGNTLEA
jgi:hypothetical protein